MTIKTDTNLQDASPHAGHEVHLLEEGTTAYPVDLVVEGAVAIGEPMTMDVHEWTLWCVDCQTAIDPVDLGMAENSFDII